MPQENKTKKINFEGSLARRAFLICLLLLILPLTIHSFLLYAREIRLIEQNLRLDLRAIGSEAAERLSERIHMDWRLIESKDSNLALKTIPIESNTPRYFAKLQNPETLLLGVATSPNEALTAERSLLPFLTLPESASFPIDMSLGALPEDQWQESFSIQDTELLLTLGTSRQRIHDLQTLHLAFRIGSFLFLIAIIGGGAVYLLLRKAYRPLNALQLTMERVAEGAIHSRYTPHAWGFEINAIGACFNETLDSVLRHQEETEREKVAKEKLAQELNLGHVIQDGLLPKSFPSMPHLEIGTGSLPAKEVGGDFYDLFSLPSGKCMIAIADIAGKGISACLFSLGLRSSLRALASSTDNLSEIVAKANELFLLDAKDNGDFATLWIGLLDQNKLHYLSLGHPPILLNRRGTISELSTHHPAIGLMALNALQSASLDLESGDTLLLYSDGITEAHDATQALYGLDQLKTCLGEVAAKPAQTIVNHVLQDLHRFSTDTEQHDDLTLLCIRFV